MRILEAVQEIKIRLEHIDKMVEHIDNRLQHVESALNLKTWAAGVQTSIQNSNLPSSTPEGYWSPRRDCVWDRVLGRHSADPVWDPVSGWRFPEDRP